MDLQFSGELWFWRGPSPYHFVSVPDEQCGALEAASASVTYGWGMIPVAARIGSTKWTTSLFPKNGGYLVPVKDKVRKAEGLELGDMVTIRLTVAV
ncbi:hypothetical protein Rhe02_65060 [Rhizocola hellebori]|uniref:DUF1905 domain-containing protein n=1 Tax=Rhizocola hellebori TaxID=1392758 RepID=A0A8J3VIJ1_9ACTN|nr:DUF1905 domain-containing protein [Rhizocola hellebori]GIH08439.1 hypothetical protein Rhe02_65060 [Rhizocola hellebori]